MTIGNKAVISGIFDGQVLAAVKRLGCRYFRKPVEFVDLEHWIAECEERIDLSQMLGFRRREERSECSHDVFFHREIATEACDGKIVNQSPSGLCVSADRTPSLYEVVTLQANAPLAPRRAMVRWTKETDDGKYLIGLSHVQADERGDSE